MSKIDYQALREAAQNAKDLGGINNYKRGEQAVAEFESLITPHIVLSLLDELEAAEKRISELESLTEPQLPHPVVVPDAIEIDDDFDSAFEHGKAVGWNAYRAAMLQGADDALTNDDTKRVGELVMWIKRLAHSLRKSNPDSKLQSDAMDYLSRKGLIGVKDILR